MIALGPEISKRVLGPPENLADGRLPGRTRRRLGRADGRDLLIVLNGCADEGKAELTAGTECAR